MKKKLNNFAVLMCVYGKDDLGLFKQAVNSVFSNTYQPETFFLIVDGPVSKYMKEFIVSKILARNHVEVYWQPCNRGLTACLNLGLRHIKQDFVIRADSDDINLPDRFYKLSRKILEGYDLVGSNALEYVARTGQTYRKNLPLTQYKITSYSALRNPFLHMTVCFKREFAISLGGYPEILYREDYGLWLRFLGSKARVANLREPLVKASWGNSFTKRRADGNVITEEFKLMKLKFQCLLPLHYPKIFFSFFIRAVPLIIGGNLLKFIYTNVIRRQGNEI